MRPRPSDSGDVEDEESLFSNEVWTTKMWLLKQQPHFLLHPAQSECIKSALKFLPALKNGLAAYRNWQRIQEEGSTEEDEPPRAPLF